MALEKKSLKDWLVTGRGNPGTILAKSDEVIMGGESESMESIFPSQEGGSGNDHGAKPIFMTGEGPNHMGRGTGRGHGPESK